MNEGSVPRYSTAYFAYPAYETPVVPLPTEKGKQITSQPGFKASKSKYEVDKIVARLYGRPEPREEDY